MIAAIIYFDCALLLMDAILIRSFRHFLIEFLRSKKNKSKVKALHSSQSLSDRVTLSYIRPLLKKYIKEFDCFHKMYLGELYVLLPQYALVLTCNLLLIEKSLLVDAVFFFAKLIMWIVIRSYEDGNRVSVFRKG